MTNPIPVQGLSEERLSEIAQEFSELGTGMPSELQDGPGAVSAFYTSLSIADVRALVTEVQHTRAAEAAAREAVIAECIAETEAFCNFGDYKREELTADYGQPRFDLMHAIIGQLRLLSASPASPSATGVRVKALDDVAAERQRQMDAEGWTPEHDDQHTGGEMAGAAACYAAFAALPGRARAESQHGVPSDWPWAADWWKPKDRRRDLVRAAALLIAEVERLDRLSSLVEQP